MPEFVTDIREFLHAALAPKSARVGIFGMNAPTFKIAITVRRAMAIALIFTVAPLAGATKRSFTTGKLLDIGASERVIDGTVYKSAEFTVQVADIVYTAREARIMRWTKDVGQGLIVGDPVQVAIDGGSLIFLKPDGKEMKTTIIKRTRAPSP
jgi:hypothetical protein